MRLLFVSIASLLVAGSAGEQSPFSKPDIFEGMTSDDVMMLGRSSPEEEDATDAQTPTKLRKAKINDHFTEANFSPVLMEPENN